MVENRSLRDYVVPLVQGLHSSISKLTIQANNFDIKLVIIQMIKTLVQFQGLPNDELNANIVIFLKICDTFNHNGVIDDAIRLRLFAFSLRDKAKNSLNSLPIGSITTCDDLAQKFLFKFFPLAKTIEMRNNITSSMQLDSESLYEAWKRYKELLRHFAHHDLPK